jgi:hypothetical protein
MRRTERFELGERVYEMQQLPLHHARDLRLRLLKTVGPALAQAVASGGADALNGRAAGAALNQLVTAINAEDLKWAMARLCENTSRILEQEGKAFPVPLNTDDIIADQFEGDRLFHADEFLAHGIQLNLGQYFLSMVRALKLEERLKQILSGSPSPSPAASTGTSGDSSAAGESTSRSKRSRGTGR